MGSERKHLKLLVLLWLFTGGLAMATSQLVGSDKCVRKCGDVSIPYPFGTTKDCYYNEDFLIPCDNSSSPHVPFLWMMDGIGVINISLDGQLRIRASVVADCYDEQTGEKKPLTGSGTFLKTFPFSYTRNKFTAVGCDTSARFQGVEPDFSRQTGCMSLCSSDDDFPINGDCSGVGCCQTRIPKGVLSFTVFVDSFSNHKNLLNFNPCGFAFLVEEEAYNFSKADFRSFQNKTGVPAVLDWAIGNITCEEARQNTTSFACKENSHCNNSDNGPGYNCFCSQGYKGNPYLSNGCTDVNECEDSNLSECVDNMCVNVEGGYNCTCPVGQEGDGKRDGSGCRVVDKCRNGEGKGGDGCTSDSFAIKISVGVGIGFLVLLMGSGWLFWGIKNRKLMKFKEHFFQNNGGLLLEQLCGRNTSANPTKIFSAEELKKATNNYNEDMIVGLGGFGTVYKGIFSDNSIVAIKKSKLVDQSQIEQFINEVFVLSQINHRNVVKLLGCCLETEVPLLVYEFISNGTLFEHIHDESKTSYLSWDTRLRIAAETAGVLAYLHSATSTPIIHRDIKSTNILLDENYTSKVSDFGASRLVPLDEAQITTMVQGTLGYLDPEYLHTSQLTDKSDVYSFGVVLVELLTGKKAICFKRPEDERCLAMYFVSSLKNDRLFHVLEDRIVNDGNTEQLKEVSNLAMRCLRVKGEERPSMKEVAMELEGIMRKMVKHSWDNVGLNSEETEYLLGEKSDSTSAGYDSIKDHLLIPIGDGR